MKSKHTKGELTVDIGMDEERWGYSIMISAGGEAIGSIYGDTPENCQANADRIADRVNGYDELIDALKLWMKCSGSTEWAKKKRSSMEDKAYDKTIELIMRHEKINTLSTCQKSKTS